MLSTNPPPRPGSSCSFSSSIGSSCHTNAPKNLLKPEDPPLQNDAHKEPEAWAAWFEQHQAADRQSAHSSADAQLSSTCRVARPGGVKDGYVLDKDGHPPDPLAFFSKNGYMASPDVPKNRRRKRMTALLRHRFTRPHCRPCLQPYPAHAKQMFDCDFSCVCVASTNDSDLLVLAQTEGPESGCFLRCDSMCGHAMLMHDGGVMVVKDVDKDWRFKNNPILQHFLPPDGRPLKFYASAPLRLSTPQEGGSSEVTAGRLCIMASEPRPDFSEADGALLSSIARMASDALEKEYQALRASKVAAMQRSAAALIRADHVGRANDRTSHDGGASNSSSDRSQQSGLDLDPHIFEKSCRHLHRVLGADAVAAIDISSFSIEHQKALDSPVVHSAYPQTPWINGLATPGGPLTPPPEDSCPSPPDLASSPALQRPVWQTHRSNRSQSASICQQLSSPDGDEVCMIEPAQGAQLIAFCAGPEHSPPEADGGAERAICSWLTKWRREHRAARPTVYYTAVDSDTETEEGPSLDAKNPLSSLVPSDTTMYMAMPAFDDREQPTFMLLVSFIQPTQLDEADRLFLESVGAILYGSIISRRAQAVDRAQLRFIQQVQHELRTPLHAILGIVDHIKQAMATPAEEEGLTAVDLREEGVLASLLDSIRLAGSNLNSILDDVLDFGAASGLRSNPRGPSARVEDVDLSRLVEEVALEELEHLKMTVRQKERLGVSPNAIPKLLIDVSPAVAEQRWRVDRSGMRKVLSKILSNALRFTREGFVEVVVRHSVKGPPGPGQHDTTMLDFVIVDTGTGMTQDFIDNHLTAPFAKGDSFQSGTGLSMTLVASVVNSMGGNLSVRSEIGMGTRVKVTLPVNSVGESATPSPDEEVRLHATKVFFYGFEQRGLVRLQSLLTERYSRRNIEKVAEPSNADLFLVSDVSLHGFVADAGPLSGCKSRARVVVATSDLSKPSEVLSALEGFPVHVMKPPFGPVAFKALDNFLKEEAPKVMRKPTASAAASASSALLQAAETPSPERRPPLATLRSEQEKGKMVAEALVQSSGPPPPYMPLAGKEFKILIVEDNPLNMKILTTVVRRLKCRFEEAFDGAEAVEKFKSFNPSIVLLDISLPILDGFEVCTRMRAHKTNVVPKIVAITALSSHEDKMRGLNECGMDDWRTKPVAVRTLSQDLATWKKAWENQHTPSPTQA